jgi:hypothetical protein
MFDGRSSAHTDKNRAMPLKVLLIFCVPFATPVGGLGRVVLCFGCVSHHAPIARSRRTRRAYLGRTSFLLFRILKHEKQGFEFTKKKKRFTGVTKRNQGRTKHVQPKIIHAQLMHTAYTQLILSLYPQLTSSAYFQLREKKRF